VRTADGERTRSPGCCLAKLCCCSITMRVMDVGSPPAWHGRHQTYYIPAGDVTGTYPEYHNKPVEKCLGKCSGEKAGPVGAELRRVSGLLAAASPFPDLPLKAQ